MLPTNFRKILLVAVEEGLSSLGDSPKRAILFHLEVSFKITKKHIAANLAEFLKALEGIFGPGASYVEKLIVKHLYEKVGLKFEEEKMWNFLDYVDNAKKHLSLQEHV